jgi:inner membrane protein
MIWWYWIIFGLALAAIELATPGGFFVIFFAIAALLLGVLELLGMLGTDWVQWSLFPVISLIGLALFRKPFLQWMRRGEHQGAVDSLVGEVAIAAGPIEPGGHGRAELRGSTWSARNVGVVALAAGGRCRVVAVRGLELEIRSERGD